MGVWSPGVGSTSGADTFTGDGGNEGASGGAGNDTLFGGGGDDDLSGDDGNDSLSGGDGNDDLIDNNGVSSLSGDDGNDTISVLSFSGGLNVFTLNGGNGNDTITFGTSATSPDTAIIFGGDGDDVISANGGTVTADGGAGADRFVLGASSVQLTYTLGAGIDTIEILGGFSRFNLADTTVTDFAAGALGDVLNLGAYYETNLVNWDGASNPFTSGHVRFLQVGGDALLQIDRDGGGDTWTTLVTFELLTASALTAANFVGWGPDGALPAGQIIDGTGAPQFIEGGYGSDTISGLGGNDTLSGRAGHDTLYGGDGDDFIDGGLGADVGYGGAGDDRLFASRGADTLHGEEGHDTIEVQLNTETGGYITAYGEAGDDTFTASVNLDPLAVTSSPYGGVLYGGDGSDRFILSGGSISVSGGAGSDVITLGSRWVSPAYELALGVGSDLIQLGVPNSFAGFTNITATVSDFQAGAGGDILALTGYLQSNRQAGQITNWDGVTDPFTTGHLRTLQSGADTLVQIDLNGGANSFITLVTLQNVQAATLTASNIAFALNVIIPTGMPGSLNDMATGTALADYIATFVGDDQLSGLAGADILNGGAGGDTMTGGDGDDTYHVDSVGDVVNENAGQGNDTLRASVSITALAGNVENLILEGGAVAGNGNDLGNVITGNALANGMNGLAGVDVLNGNDGADTIDGGEGDDTLDGGNHDDQLLGGGNADTLYGRAGNDTLDGGAGANTLEGGGGDDTYIVRGASDIVVELAGAGTDSIVSTATRTLGNFQENLTLAGAAAINGFGNALANSITGNDAENTLNGLAGADVLAGGLGADTLNGGDGADTLNGGDDGDLLDGGNDADTLNGGDSADTLYGRTANDTLNGDAGADAIFGGDGDDVINGGADNDVLDGNNNNDTLSGGDGVDEIYGRQNNDTLNGDAGNDQLFGGDGDDQLNGGADGDMLDGGNGIDVLSGGDGADALYGRNGEDALDGGLGTDTLSGGNDADTFVFSTGLSGANVDTIQFYNVTQDTIQLDVDVFSAIGIGTLAANAFVIGGAATTADHRIIYDPSTGALFYDADGNGVGAAVQFAVLGTGLALTNADFVGGP